MADKSKLDALYAEQEALEKELDTTTKRLKAKISKKKAEVLAANIQYLNESGAEWMADKTNFFAGHDLLGMPKERPMEMHAHELVMITSGLKTTNDCNGGKYAIFDCVTVNPGYGSGNSLTVSVSTVALQSLKTDGLENVSQEIWTELYQKLQRDMLNTLLTAVKDMPELSEGNPMKLLS